MKDTAVVILNWNGKYFLEKFLPNLIKCTEEAEIIVIDNCSTDNSVDFVKQNFPIIKIIQNAKNFGYAGGYNQGLKEVKAKYFVLLNSDIEVTENWLAPMINVMESNSDIAVLQPKILDYNNKHLFEYAGGSGGFIDFLGFPFCRGRIFNSIETDNNQYDNQLEIFWASGSCMMVKSEIFNLLNGLDDDFFAHMEEIDFCWRVQTLGYKIKVVPESTVYHIGGGTLPKSSPKKTFLNFRNNYIMLLKNLPSNHLAFVLVFRLFFDWSAAFKFFFQKNFGDFKAVFKAQYKFLSKLGYYYSKRNFEKNLSNKNVYKRSIVFDFFVLRKKYFSKLSSKNFN